MPLRPGWLQRQLDRVSADVAAWPAWMRREAGLEEDAIPFVIDEACWKCGEPLAFRFHSDGSVLAANRACGCQSDPVTRYGQGEAFTRREWNRQDADRPRGEGTMAELFRCLRCGHWIGDYHVAGDPCPHCGQHAVGTCDTVGAFPAAFDAAAYRREAPMADAESPLPLAGLWEASTAGYVGVQAALVQAAEAPSRRNMGRLPTRTGSQHDPVARIFSRGR